MRHLLFLSILILPVTSRAEFLTGFSAHDQTRIVCSIAAAEQFQIPVNIMLAVADLEHGKPGQRVQNSNGTYDIGMMQFNTSYIKELTLKYGITEADVSGLADECYPFKLAAWRIRGHIINDAGDIWSRISNYHSRTPIYNQKYRRYVISYSLKWANWIKSNFDTKEWTLNVNN